MKIMMIEDQKNNLLYEKITERYTPEAWSTFSFYDVIRHVRVASPAELAFMHIREEIEQHYVQ